ncbi:hypothetical protein [Embleya scabrispora]|uniref:hypothetical protein n=1 Tax=Embleya scabrispora TaxID=159449 RepID=UPI000370D26E|nr:hypothetical protein [Embleya scabrispora]MYS80778.1 hypothetical protein [Streptomyces sp. SID5474]
MSAEYVEVSHHERPERLRAQLRGGLAVRAGGRTAPPRGANLLYGVMLRAAARLDAGLEPTELEQGMLEFLRVMVPEEEIREFGRVYAQEHAARATGSVLPATLTERAIEDGYEFADLVEDVPALRAESGTQPNLNVVDLDRPEEGAAADDAGFVAGLGEYGYGVTLVTASDHHDDEPAPAAGEGGPGTAGALDRVLVELKYFKCYRESDEWSGSDEIYFCTAASSDTGHRHENVTRAYGDVDKDEIHQIDGGTYLFNASADAFVTATVVCWERDQSPPGWFDEMYKTLNTLSGLLQLLAQKLKDYGGHFDVPEYHDLIDYVEIANMLVLAWGGFMKIFSNPDDYVAERTLVFDRAALKAWATGTSTPIAGWHFNGKKGEGHYVLVTSGTAVVNTRPHTITLPSLDGTPGKPGGPAWAATAPLPNGAMSRAPALTSRTHSTAMDCMVQSFGDGPGELWHARSDGTTWGAFTRGPAGRTRHRPALAWFKNVLHCAFNQDDTLYLSKLQGTTWTTPEPVTFGGVAPGTVRGAPALAAQSDTQLFCAVTTIADRVRYAVSDGTRWGTAFIIPGPGAAPDPALMIASGSVFLCAYRSRTGDQIWVSEYNGFTWGDPVRLPGTTSAGPALGFNYGRPICVVRAAGTNEQLYWSMRDDKGDKTWSSFSTIPNISSADAPALTHLGPIPGDTTAPYGRTVLLFRY